MNSRKKHRIGVITMHYPNCGSALQAYATQEKLKDLGYEVEIIDYKYPTAWHRERRNPVDAGIEVMAGTSQGQLARLFHRLGRCIRKYVLKRKMPLDGKGLKISFIENELNLSEKRYGKREEIAKDPPIYDLYLTGSDQVWNPRFAVGDTVFMCDFAPDDIPRISYASSFATETMPVAYEAAYRKYLSKYRAISVREKSGIKLTKELTGIDAHLVCDPTLLLDKARWDDLANQSQLVLDQPYLLTYILKYAYDPYPEIERLIEDARRQTGLEVVAITGVGELRSSIDSLREAPFGPKEFVRLFRDASMVITTSFHGTAFSLLYEKNFYSIIQSAEQADSRILDLLRELGAEHCALPVSAPELIVRDVDCSAITLKLNAFRKQSIDYLASSLSDCLGAPSKA